MKSVFPGLWLYPDDDQQSQQRADGIIIERGQISERRMFPYEARVGGRGLRHCPLWCNGGCFHFPSLIFSIFEISQSNYLQRKSFMVLEIRMYRDRTFIFIEYSAIEQYLSRLIIAH